MARKPHKYTRKLQFDTRTRNRIRERDFGTCIFCQMEYQNTCTDALALEIKDIMHFIPKSQLGLGIEQNGAVGCRYHHNMLDNGNQGVRKDMLARFESYLKRFYPDWNKEKLVYKKYNF